MKLRVRNATRNCEIADRADIADTSEKRRAGLLQRARLEAGEGLWIAPCEAIHTAGMKFRIDAVFLDKQRRVLKIKADMKLWRIAACMRAHSVLELPAGVCAATGTLAGDQLEFDRYTPA